MNRSAASASFHLKYKVLEYDYLPDETIFREDSEKVHALKEIIFHRLSNADRVLLLMYAEFGNIRALARHFNVSRNAVHQQIKRIRKQITQELEHYHEDNH